MKNRVVHITSLSFRDQPVEKILGIVEDEAKKGCDLIALPESWTGNTPETLEEGTTARMREIAKQ